MPQSFTPPAPCCQTPWFCKRQLPHYTHFISHYVFSSSPESIVLSLPSRSQPFHLFCSHLCHTHSALFFSLHLSFIFDPLPSLGHWSLWLWPCSQLSSSLLNSSISLLVPARPFLSVLCLCLAFVKEYQKVSVSAVVGSILAGPCVVLVSLSTSLSAPQIIQLGRLPGSTKPLPARWHSEIKNPCVHVGVCTFRSPQLCLCVCVSCVCVYLPLCTCIFVHICEYVCVRKRKHTARELWFHCISLLKAFATFSQSLCLSS